VCIPTVRRRLAVREIRRRWSPIRDRANHLLARLEVASKSGLHDIIRTAWNWHAQRRVALSERTDTSSCVTLRRGRPTVEAVASIYWPSLPKNLA